MLVELNMFVSEEVEEPLSPTSKRAVVSNLISCVKCQVMLRDES